MERPAEPSASESARRRVIRAVSSAVAGRASIVNDRAKIEELWSPAMKLFFPGGKDDPDLCLIRVEVDSAEYWDGPGSIFGKALYIALTAVTNDPASLSENERFEL